MKAQILRLLVSVLSIVAGSSQWVQGAAVDPYFDLHIIAVDRDGSAMMPNVRKVGEKFVAKPKRMKGELLELAPKDQSVSPPPFRKDYYEYIHAILDEIRRKRPKRIVFYIHGGMNFIDGAVAKGAQLASEKREQEDDEYRISICWSSNLLSTYQEHLVSNVEGLSSPFLGAITAPLTLLSDVGGAIADAPRTLVSLLMNDANAAYPWGFKRNRYAFARLTELEEKRRLGAANAMDVSLGMDERSLRPGAVAMDVAAWAATKPAKIATAPVIDQLGSGAWQMMLRRTRTMFERESSIFVRHMEKDARWKERNRIEVRKGKLVRVNNLTAAELDYNERAEYAARLGAVRLFFEEAERFVVSSRASSKWRPEIVLIGHSMGAIVTNEILARCLNIDFDHIVFLAAACSVNDFTRVGIPYLRQHPRARFYNLCLHPAAERSEAQPGRLVVADPLYIPLELAPRGSLLVWIDSFLDHPESEGDRRFGRWENAVLMADAIPKSLLNRMTLKGFGRDRTAANAPAVTYTVTPSYRFVKSGGVLKREYFAEPREHGQFSRYESPDRKPAKPSFRFTSDSYWQAEPSSEAANGSKVKSTRRR